ncbi:hypothetical protein PAXINDRAFT_157172 [Paxillus involutus ATCC 200175]|uniref:Mug135-like C-terminal domain-containing protein n=1 Tax=Paxillus involutus ATCC 200175 TaxID=664439 RepID=A0A0C9ST37_PAXIN|nr:hypothetical protein PAXINDRAFT_157172 [Paxillus involutus ATCC 200175]
MAALPQPPPPPPNPPLIAPPVQPNDPNVPVAGPQAAAPPWFQGIIQPLFMDLRNDLQNDMWTMMRAEFLPGFKRLVNQHRGDGKVVSFDIVPFTNGNDPTQPPDNLPPLHSIDVIENLNEHDLMEYLNGYGVVPPVSTNPYATNYLQKEILKGLIGSSV